MDLSRYADLFLTESREHLSALNHALLELERTSGGSEAIGEIFRGVHTIKGMSATMGYVAVAELSHELETLMERLRRRERRVSPVLMDVLFQAVDALERAIENSAANRQKEIDIAPMLERLRSFGGGTATTDSPSPASVAWAREVPTGPGTLVRVRLVAGTPLAGVRAILIVQKAQSLGRVTALTPDIDQLQAEDFDREFAFRVETASGAGEIETILRAAGDIERLQIGDAEAAEADGAAAVADMTDLSVIAGADGVGAAISATEPTGALAGGSGGALGPAGLRHQRHVRIDLRRLDTLMNLIGELVITRGRLTQLAGAIGDSSLEETVAQTSRLVSDLRDQIMISRMVPVWQVFDRFPRLVRDAGRALDKRIDFTIEGKEIELDRSMLDEIGDPIVHLLRNAIDHGLEGPQERIAAGKSAAGRVTLSAMRDRSSVLIRVRDDGRGIDHRRVLQRAKSMGLIEQTKTELSDDELFRLVARPGFSTAERVTDISGRGVGIDAVQTRVRALGGSVEMRSVPNAGTTVTVRLPLTLAIVRALLARVGTETYALPMTHVNGTVHLDPGALRTMKGQEVLMLRDDVLPLLRLSELVRLPGRGPAPGEQVVVLEMTDRRAGLVVDELTGQQEVVVKQFDTAREALPLFSGATILGDGAPALIVDVNSLL